MSNKRGFQLSLNMIITVILALIFLGVAVAFVRNMVPKEMPIIPSACDIYPPTSEQPVCISKEIELKRGDEIQLRVAFFNDEDAAIPESAIPTVTCSTSVDGDVLDLKTSGTGAALEIGDATDYLVILKVPKDAPKALFPCNIKLSNTQKSFAIVVA